MIQFVYIHLITNWAKNARFDTRISSLQKADDYWYEQQWRIHSWSEHVEVMSNPKPAEEDRQ